MITLAQARNVIAAGESLEFELTDIDARLDSFRKVEGETVHCRAFVQEPDAFGRVRCAYVALMPVAKSLAIGALERERSKVIQRLAEIGVTVEK